MNDRLFKELLNTLLSEAEVRRDEASRNDGGAVRDMWSAVAGHLDNARKRMRR